MADGRRSPGLRIVSGGQTGADRGGLDAAIELGVPHGGWCPRGRRSEDGAVPARYALRETASAEYEERTERNVEHSDGTVVFTHGAPTGGSLLTIGLAAKHRKPCLHIDLGRVARAEIAGRVGAWMREHGIAVLNVAGSRESKSPGIHDEVMAAVIEVLKGRSEEEDA